MSKNDLSLNIGKVEKWSQIQIQLTIGPKI